MTRHVIVVDCETNGLEPHRHQAVEVAWWDLVTGERGLFIPPHDVSTVLWRAEVEALRVNRYIDRIAGQPQDDGTELLRLSGVLAGNTLAGSNPAFDACMLRRMLDEWRDTEGLAGPGPWHHRLWDLSAYAAGVLGLDELPGLATVCDRLSVGVQPDHTAETDVTATGLCLQELRRRACKAM